MSARSASRNAVTDVGEIEVIAPNFSRRLSGVTSTLERLLPVQARTLRIAALGPGLSPSLPHLRWRDVPKLARKPKDRRFRIWHARRNLEMLAGVALRDLLRFPLKLVFTSASQRRHTKWTRFLIGRMDAVISTSAATASYLERPSTVIPHGIDAGAFHPAEDKAEARAALGLPDLRLVGCFGRIRHQKGTDVFVDAMLRVLPTRPDAGAVVLGRATSQHTAFLEDLKARVAAAGLQARILFPDEVAPSAVADWYRALDIYVAPQRWEGFGVTPLEAMASGVPVVATTVGAFPDLIAEETGMLIPPGNVDAMTDAVALVLDDPQHAQTLSLRGLTRVLSQFKMDNETQRICAVYEGLWNGAPHSITA